MSFSDVDECFRHVKVHKARVISCPECGVNFRSLESFKKHFRQRHFTKPVGPELRCHVDGCGFSDQNFLKISKHASVHILSGQPVFCPLGCRTSKPFATANALRIHQMYYHRNQPKLPTPTDETRGLPEVGQSRQEECMEVDTVVPETQESSQSGDLRRMEMIFGSLFLKLLSKNHVPDAAIQEIVLALGEVVLVQSNNVRKTTRAEASSLDTDETNRKCVEPCRDTSVLGRCFGPTGLFRSAYMRKKFFRTNFRFVEPVQVHLQRDKEHNECFYYYVPILETLKSMLEDEKLFDVAFRGRNTRPGYLSDYCDGLKFAKSDFFGNNTLNVFIYQDAAEVVNPLGNAAGRHKLLCVYMVLGNLPPHLRSLTENVQLVLICRNKDFMYFGPNRIFRRLIEDVKVLETEGIEVSRGSENVRVRGSIFTTLNDNLGAHQICGLTENFSRSPHFCRFCYINHSQFDADCLHQAAPRTPETHSQDLQVIEANQAAVPYQGVKRNTIFNELIHFNLFDFGAPPCVAHDLFEGWANFDLFLILRKLVADRVVKLNYLQARANFIFQKLKIKTKIDLDLTRKTKTIKAKACDIWHFIQILPLVLLKSSIDSTNPLCRMVLLIKNITDVVTSPIISTDHVYLLAALIREYLELRVGVFNDPLRPKHHYTTHYPKMIRWLGPLMSYCTLFCERKHCFFKRAVRSTLNYKNVLKFCTEHHQYYQGVLNEQGLRFEDKFALQTFLENYNDLPSTTKEELSAFGLLKPELIYVESGSYQGYNYRKDSFLFVKHDDYSESIVFLKLKLMIYDNEQNSIYMFGEKWSVVDIHERGILQANQNEEEIICQPIENFIDKTPIQSFIENNTEYLFITHALPLQ